MDCAVSTAGNHWMPIHIGDYHRETRHLTAEQHGGYLLLGMEYWTKGSLPDDDAQLARIAGMSKAQWRRNRPTIQALFTDGWNILGSMLRSNEPRRCRSAMPIAPARVPPGAGAATRLLMLQARTKHHPRMLQAMLQAMLTACLISHSQSHTIPRIARN